MIKGLFFDTRIWQVDLLSNLWNPKDNGIILDLCENFKELSDNKIKEYSFAIVTEVWEIPMRKILTILKSNGIKIFLMAREPFKTKLVENTMFAHTNFLYEGEFYFKPDAVLAASETYADLWSNITKTYITGYPRFDYYTRSDLWKSKEQVSKKYNLDVNKKWIFFPDYPPYFYLNGKIIDLFKAREDTLKALESFAISNREYQIIVKIHPSSMKPFLKKNGQGNEVSGLLLKRYKSPTEFMSVIGDERNNGNIARDLLVNSNIVAGFSSTMLMEASMINLPCINLLFDNARDLKGMVDYSKILPTAYDEQELHNMIRNNNTGTLCKEFIHKYIGQYDGNSCKNICDAIKNELKIGV